jgi:hypothetical protein
MTESARCYYCGQPIADEELALRGVWVAGRKLLVPLCATCDGKRMEDEQASRKYARIAWLLIVSVVMALFAVIVIATAIQR